MRHLVKGKKLNRNTESRKALVKSIVVALFKNEKIETTLAKAKYIRPFAEKLITRAKENTLSARRILIADLQDKDIVNKLLNDIAPSFLERKGGYTRIQRTSVRYGDVTQMATISLVREPKVIENTKSKVVKKSVEKVLTKKKEISAKVSTKKSVSKKSLTKKEE